MASDDDDSAETETNEEGARSFARFAAAVNRGELEAVASYELHDLLAYIGPEAKSRRAKVKGKFTLEISLTADEDGTVSIWYDVRTKRPPLKTMPTMLYLTTGNNLTEKDPRQQELPLASVPSRPREVRKVEKPGLAVKKE